MTKKYFLIIMTALIAAGCASPESHNIPQALPLEDSEKQVMTCTEIESDLLKTQATLWWLREHEAKYAAAHGAIGIMALSLGAFNTESVTRTIAYNTASTNTKTRYEQLQTLGSEKECVYEKFEPKPEDVATRSIPDQPENAQ